MIVAAWLGWVLPPQQSHTPLERKRARVMAALIGVEILTTAVFSVIGDGWFVPVSLLAMAVGIAAAIALRSNQLSLAGHLILLATASAAFSGGVFTGGVANPAFAWIFFVPLFAGLMLDTNGATVWSLISGAVAITALYLHQHGLLPERVYEAGETRQMLMDIAGMTVVSTVVMRLYLQSTSTAHDQLADALQELRDEIIIRRDAERSAHEATLAQQAFLASVSHEIRTPLNGIIGVTELLTRSPLDEGQRRHVSALTRSATTLRRLLSDLLDLSKLQSGGFTTVSEPMSPHDVVTGVTHLQSAASTQLSFTTTIDDDVPEWVSGDAIRLAQMVGNLCANACHFARADVAVHMAWREGNLVVDVDDDGPGIPDHERSGVFQPFRQIEGTIGGTGLGLAVVRGLSEAMNGEVSFDQAPLGGARARLTLPMPKTEAPAGAGDRDTANRDLPLRVLVVDDDAVNRLVIGGLLASLRVEYSEATTGEEALAALEKEAFDVVLMDLRMPGMGGLEAARQARSRGMVVPIVCLTASSAARVESDVATAGMNGLLGKPVTRAELAQTLRNYAPRPTGLASF